MLLIGETRVRAWWRGVKWEGVFAVWFPWMVTDVC